MKKVHFKLPLPFYIAFRYVFSKKKYNVINIISIIAGVGIFASVTALVIVMSVYNGMASLVEENFNNFNPDFKISLNEGKSFPINSFPIQSIASIQGVTAVQEIVSDLALVTYKDKQLLIELKGVPAEYPKVANLQEMAVLGNFEVISQDLEVAMVGSINATQLQFHFNELEILKFHYPKRHKNSLTNPTDAFQTQYLQVGGVFQSNTDYDSKVLFVPLAFARDLCAYHNEVTSIEVFINERAQLEKIQHEIEALVGTQFTVKNCYEQEEVIFKAIKVEKLVIFVILAFIILIAVFNIIGIIGMMLVEKKRDIEILGILGSSESMVRQIFAFHGLLIAAIAGAIGLIVGYFICFLQQAFEFIKLRGGANYIVTAYPIEIQITDGLLIILLIFSVSIIASFLSVLRLQKNKNNKK